MRRLECGDYYKGYLDLLKQLSVINSANISYEDFHKFISNMDDRHIIMIEEHDNRIIVSGTIFIEHKFIHDLGSVGHVEDIVIDENYRGCGLGKIIVDTLSDIAKENNCYKVILSCDDKCIGFYDKCGFIDKGITMAKYF